MNGAPPVNCVDAPTVQVAALYLCIFILFRSVSAGHGEVKTGRPSLEAGLLPIIKKKNDKYMNKQLEVMDCILNVKTAVNGIE